jgi:murein DD-endopeptidase MepM/ murein hydrolase activator NlpD
MTNWRHLVGSLLLASLSFGAMLVTAVADQAAGVSAAELGPGASPRHFAVTPPVADDNSAAAADRAVEPLVDWANVELKDGRETYLSADSPGDDGDSETWPLPAPLIPAPITVEPVAPPAAPAAVEASPAISSAPVEQLIYIVQSGDNLFRIARRHSVALEHLASANQISDPSRISVGQQLLIPGTPGARATPALTAVETTASALTAVAMPRDGLYVVQSGDSPYLIARRYGISVEDLLTLNNIADPRRLRPGHVLRLSANAIKPAQPATATATTMPTPESAATAAGNLYVIQPGDIPFEIARRFGISVDALLAANQITDPRRLQIGQQLIIPLPGTTPPATDAAVTATPQPMATPQPTTTPQATTNPQASTSGVYTIQQGDIPASIARRFGISVELLMAANQITDPRRLQIGQQLIIPAPGATAPPTSTPVPVASAETVTAPAGMAGTYTVQRGDIPGSIARRFGITANSLLAANSITDPTRLQIGQILLVPTPGPVPTVAAATGPSHFVWPVESRSISQRFRSGHGAIDIRSPTGSRVVAAAAGIVEFAGWNRQGYGYLVVIDHGDGYRTLYAHNSSVQVQAGQEVAQAELIALSGSTGRSSGPHLHLEILLNYRPVNPCLHLPGGC